MGPSRKRSGKIERAEARRLAHGYRVWVCRSRGIRVPRELQKMMEAASGTVKVFANDSQLSMVQNLKSPALAFHRASTSSLTLQPVHSQTRYRFFRKSALARGVPFFVQVLFLVAYSHSADPGIMMGSLVTCIRI